uniref:Uncharacterized protein n=1 Tax=Rheinheimera sp. BAL341 TaxID=1708203 RepID=A0A486XJ80_9GAMM
MSRALSIHTAKSLKVRLSVVKAEFFACHILKFHVMALLTFHEFCTWFILSLSPAYPGKMASLLCLTCFRGRLHRLAGYFFMLLTTYLSCLKNLKKVLE